MFQTRKHNNPAHMMRICKYIQSILPRWSKDVPTTSFQIEYVNIKWSLKTREYNMIQKRSLNHHYHQCCFGSSALPLQRQTFSRSAPPGHHIELKLSGSEPCPPKSIIHQLNHCLLNFLNLIHQNAKALGRPFPRLTVPQFVDEHTGPA